MIGIRQSVARVEELRRLLPALLLSMAAHLLVLQAFPYTVRPHMTPAHRSVLTVTLEPREPYASPFKKRSLSTGTASIHGESGVPVQAVSLGLPIGASPSEAPGLPADTAIHTGQALPVAPEDLSLSAEQPILPAAVETSTVEPELVQLESELAPHMPQGALPLLDYYYTSKEVDEPARAIGDGLLEYPREALRQNIAGTVRLRLYIDEFGTLVRSEVVNAHPADIFDVAAREAVHTMRFLPARKSGQPVRSQRTVEITFDPDPEALRNLGATRGR